MNKREFMGSLSGLLMDISPEERIEALQYYEDYFADAGEENEGEIIAKLQSPEALAAVIKAELLNNRTGQNGEYTENGYQNADYKKDIDYPQPKPSAYEDYKGYEENIYDGKLKEDLKREKKKLNGSQITLLILACIFASPIILGVGSGVFGIVIGILATVFALSLALGIAGLACVISGVIAVAVGVMNIVVFLPGGLLVLGAGIFVFGLGLLLMELSGLCWKGLSVIFRKGIQFIKGIFNKKEVYA